MLYIRKSVEKPFSAFQLNEKGTISEAWYWEAHEKGEIDIVDTFSNGGVCYDIIINETNTVFHAKAGDYILNKDGKFMILSEYVFNELYEPYFKIGY